MPGWLLDVLERCIEPLEAELMLRRAIAGRLAQAEEKSYRRAIAALERDSRPRAETDVPTIAPEMEAWFVANRIPYQLPEMENA